MREQRARNRRRLAVWFCLNLVIFIVCYLNYRLQLKHRYLYRTLNAGLCFSRAAAMVINFNLLLVWLPMCKYSLTWLACLATSSLKSQRLELIAHQSQRLEEKHHHQQQQQQLPPVNRGDTGCSGKNPNKFSLKRLVQRLRWASGEAKAKLQQRLIQAKINSINSFLVAVDHCKSLHTICATTITLASIVHTVAHLINVMNFSRNFDPLLSNLNMADYKGQNPFQLLISIPGITGSLMMLILIFMSLSSIDFIRNSFYDLFQIFHRLSVIFVILLLLHPASHVIKEQSNVDRHHPDLCYHRMLSHQSLGLTQVSHSASGNYDQSGARPPPAMPFRDNANVTAAAAENANAMPTPMATPTPTPKSIPSATQWLQLAASSSSNSEGGSGLVNKTTTSVDLNVIRKDNQRPLAGGGQRATTTTTAAANSGARLSGRRQGRRRQERRQVRRQVRGQQQQEGGRPSEVEDRLCLDPRPLFVAQSSICWYVLAAGLSCYLFDLLLRRLRRSRSSIELLGARLDAEQNLVELVLSNNHRRFALWAPGQFVYLNCPQIAAYEWHPFTISSMDDQRRQFTLHIKTGGDWTRKLRQRLLINGATTTTSCASVSVLASPAAQKGAQDSSFNQAQLEQVLPDLQCYNLRIGQPQVRLVRVTRRRDDDEHAAQEVEVEEEEREVKSCQDRKQAIDLEAGGLPTVEPLPIEQQQQQQQPLHLYIDGPFHSPFERLLEQQVSVCIANGVGWTAFSSVFQCIAAQQPLVPSTIGAHDDGCHSAATHKHDWPAKWSHSHGHGLAEAAQAGQSRRPHANEPPTAQGGRRKPPTGTKLHLMVIVTSLEQLKPFYQLACEYFNRLNKEELVAIEPPTTRRQPQAAAAAEADRHRRLNPVREITAFITRSSGSDDTVQEFCRQENLSASASAGANTTQQTSNSWAVRVNDLFTIHFGKPQFDLYLGSFGALYQDQPKVSVYCCGSYQVKRDVRHICHNLNKLKKVSKTGPFFSYHEENF